VFEDRRHAGRCLAARLGRYRAGDVVIVGLPRGGAVVADEVARALEAPLDVVVVRRLRVPGDSGHGIGTLAGGVNPEVVLDHDAISTLGVAPEYVCDELATELRQVRLREALLREGRPATSLAGRTVILVDDAIITGDTVRASLRAVRLARPHRVLLAVPVAPAGILPLLRPLVDHVVCLRTPRRVDAASPFYRDFQEVSDGEVITLLAEARARWAHAGPRGRPEESRDVKQLWLDAASD
jgi:putative phosphoribosyl transferase